MKDGEISLLGWFRYWVTRLLRSFYTYYYIFIYIYLIPVIIFFIWWLMVIWDKLTSVGGFVPYFSNVWFWLVIASAVLALVFSIYRWLRSTFSIYNAIESDEFTMINFEKSLVITKWKCLEIFWNLFAIWFIVWIISAIIWAIFSWLLWSYHSSVNPDLINNLSAESIRAIAKASLAIYPSEVIIQVVSWITFVIILIYTYFLFSDLASTSIKMLRDLDMTDYTHNPLENL